MDRNNLPENRIGDYFDDGSPDLANVYWREGEFPGVDVEWLDVNAPQITVGPGKIVDIDAVDSLEVGKSVEATIEVVIGRPVHVVGELQGFIPRPRPEQSDTMALWGQIRVAPEVSFDDCPSRTLYIPVEQLRGVETTDEK
jgi:hypothetical protein